MDQSSHENVNNQPLKRLVSRALLYLEKLGYSRRSLRRYRTIWQHLIAFSRHQDLGDTYSENLAARFVDAYRIRDGESVAQEGGWRRHIVFGVKVLGDFAREGRIERSVTDMQKLQIPPAMKKPLRDYEQYCKERRHLRPISLQEGIREVTVFLAFLGSRNLKTLGQMQPIDVSEFVASRHRLRPKTISRIVSNVRGFLRFLTLRGILQQDLSQVLPKIRVPRDAAIPSVWDPALLVQLLEAIDRSSPKGKRDYAIILLACRLGLRLADIRTLALDNLNWDAATLEITQSKTRMPLCLPLTEEVGEALIDYLKSGRPQTSHREVFLKLTPPFGPFAQDTHLHYIVDYWKELAGIHFRSEQRHGLHSLRHTLATKLLQQETPFHVISGILGHATTASTMIYAKADVEALRSAALDTEEVSDVDQ
ncbi:MAG: tyrosine-type recombinase/integrase [Gammaproteobacteria bacterium]|nr:tyrosine-type recombinase/integrase [Gammaproteobacteria bacterium]